MELAKIEVRGTCAKVIYSRDIPKGIVGATITIKYLDPMWDNLVKTVVFRGCVTRDVIDDGEVVTIPHEVVERSSTPLIVGISGADADNNLVIPTFWADLGIVQDAADPSGDPSADPSLPIWAVLRAELDRLKNSGATDEQIAAAVAAYLEENPVGTGTVRTVNDTEPDENGNVSINIPTDYVKTVNGTAPDKNGNVDITIPDSGGNVDLEGYATEQWVKDQKYLTAVPDGYAKTEDIPTKVSELDNDSGYLTKHQSLEGYAKTEDIPTKPEDIGAQPAGSYLTEVPTGYATEEFVKNRIAEAELGGEEVDLSGYAQKSELPTKVSQLQNDKGYLTAVPDGYAKTEDIPKSPADIGAQSEGDYALRSEIPSVPVKSVNGKTGAVSLTASDVKARPDSWMPTASEVGALPSSTVIPTVPTKVSEFTNDAGYLTEHQDLSEYAKKTEIPAVPVKSVNGKTGAVSLTASDVKARPDTWMPSASDVGALPSTTVIPTVPTKLSAFTNDSGFITGYTETDPTVPAWAKQSTKPSYSKSEVGLGNVDNVKQYSASNPPPYPVTSVNGKTGAVTLDASAVGALPASTTIPTKVSQLTNDKGYLTEHQDISGKLDASALPTAINSALAQAKMTLGYHTDGLLYLFVNGAPVGTGVEFIGGATGDVTGVIDSANNIILTGVGGDLADGTYTIKYEKEDGTLVDGGNLVVSSGPAYTNLLPTSVDNTGAVYNGTGFKNGYRLTGGAYPCESAGTEFFCTGYIPYTKAQASARVPMYVKGITIDLSNVPKYLRVLMVDAYNATDSYIDTLTITGDSGASNQITIQQLGDKYYKLTPNGGFITGNFGWGNEDLRYIRWSFPGTGDGVIFTVDEPIE